MTRPQPAFRSGSRSAQKAAKRGIFLELRTLCALLIALLQLSSALHFTLVPHTFSAALGGIVHVHAESIAHADGARSHSAKSQSLVADALSCAVDLCPFVDAPHASPPHLAASLSGAATFGATSLLSEAEARSPNARRVFLSAPKTSPPV